MTYNISKRAPLQMYYHLQIQEQTKRQATGVCMYKILVLVSTLLSPVQSDQ